MLYSVDPSVAVFLKTIMPLEEGIMEQEISSKPSRSILLATSSTFAAMSFTLGEYFITTVLYIAFTSNLPGVPGSC